MDLVSVLKRAVKALPIDFTRNQQYDTQTKKVIKRVCRAGSTCVDVGCHKGEVLDIMREAAPEGQFFGFEPLPHLFEALAQKYVPLGCRIFDVALSDAPGETSFNYVISNPAYSGLIRRKYDRPDEQDTTISVKVETLDRVIPADVQVDFIKIDVEGGEFGVLSGATGLLRRCRPVVIFEHGIGASDMYGTTPDRLFGLLQSCGLQVSLMKRWLKGQKALTLAEFEREYYQKRNYYFIAYP